MAKLYFRYGAMSSGKSEQLISIALNYKIQGKKVLIFSPSVDTREKAVEGKVVSRNGVEWPSIRISPDENPYAVFLSETEKKKEEYDCVLVDEAQFFTEEQIHSLSEIVDRHDVPVIAFGLKADFRNKLFPGSKALLEISDSLEEIKTVCWFCRRKGFMNLRTVDGTPVSEGEQVLVDGGEIKYVPVCRKCYKKLIENRNEFADDICRIENNDCDEQEEM